MKIEHIKGKEKGKIMLYALSTCGWCKKTRELLDKLKVDYYYLYMDKLDEKDKDKALDELSKLNPRTSFPTIIINDKECIIGFKPDEIKKVLK